MQLVLKKHTSFAFFHEMWKSDNRGQKSFGHLCNSTNYLWFNTEVWKKGAAFLLRTVYFSPPLQYIVENQKKLQVMLSKLCIVRAGKMQQLTAADGAVSSASSWSPEKKRSWPQPMKREPGGRRAFPESSQPATSVANAAEIVTLALDLSATAATVAEAQRPSLGWRNIHSRHRLTKAHYYIVGARLGRRGCIPIWRVRKNAKTPWTLVHKCRF